MVFDKKTIDGAYTVDKAKELINNYKFIIMTIYDTIKEQSKLIFFNSTFQMMVKDLLPGIFVLSLNEI
jgi:hypothetical protein